MPSLSRQLAQWIVGLRYEDLPEAVVALGRGHPVVRGAGVGLLGRADEGEVLRTGDVVGGAAVEVTARELPRVEGQQLAGAHGRFGESLPLVLGAVAPDDVVGPAEPRGVVHPASDGLVADHWRCIHGTAMAGFGSIVAGWGRMGAAFMAIVLEPALPVRSGAGACR